MKFKLTLLSVLISTFSFCQDLEGRWVNSSFTGAENMAYEFEEGNVMKMYYAGKEIPTAQPIVYSLKELDEDRHLIEMKYTNLANNLSADLIGVIVVLGKDKVEMEFWERSAVPEDYAFTEESLIYYRE